MTLLYCHTLAASRAKVARKAARLATAAASQWVARPAHAVRRGRPRRAGSGGPAKGPPNHLRDIKNPKEQHRSNIVAVPCSHRVSQTLSQGRAGVPPIPSDHSPKGETLRAGGTGRRR